WPRTPSTVRRARPSCRPRTPRCTAPRTPGAIASSSRCSPSLDLRPAVMTLTLPMKLPTSVVGSHGLPGWLWLAREAMAQGRLGALDLRELMEDATQIALLDQERAGVDVVGTGEMMRVRFIVGFYDRITGIRTLPAPRQLGQPLWDTNTPFEVVQQIAP